MWDFCSVRMLSQFWYRLRYMTCVWFSIFILTIYKNVLCLLPLFTSLSVVFILYLYVYVVKFLLSLISKNIMWTFLLHAARKLTGKHAFFSVISSPKQKTVNFLCHCLVCVHVCVCVSYAHACMSPSFKLLNNSYSFSWTCFQHYATQVCPIIPPNFVNFVH